MFGGMSCLKLPIVMLRYHHIACTDDGPVHMDADAILGKLYQKVFLHAPKYERPLTNFKCIKINKVVMYCTLSFLL